MNRIMRGRSGEVKETDEARRLSRTKGKW